MPCNAGMDGGAVTAYLGTQDNSQPEKLKLSRRLELYATPSFHLEQYDADLHNFMNGSSNELVTCTRHPTFLKRTWTTFSGW
ncbi:hypothetical protein GCM10010844_41090 [Deinococcus radiotolerans]|uniref:Uncharacterized protein n=1 Tax=Deinococcus radiotolerans TaxID=1309407 RepID=A0ABQ2FQV9_9DEIO|nr:hypothetical protein GCM10010844_41090 [Deinococcus radiotolerans]